MKRSRGFTLVELMIAVAIIAIIAAVAFPSYQGQMRKTRRGTAQAFMMDVAQREQARFLDARSYAIDPGALAALNMTPPAEITGSYTFAITEVGGAPPDFIITGIAQGSQDYRNSEDLRLCSGQCPGGNYEKARGDAATNTWYPEKW